MFRRKKKKHIFSKTPNTKRPIDGIPKQKLPTDKIPKEQVDFKLGIKKAVIIDKKSGKEKLDSTKPKKDRINTVQNVDNEYPLLKSAKSKSPEKSKIRTNTRKTSMKISKQSSSSTKLPGKSEIRKYKRKLSTKIPQSNEFSLDEERIPPKSQILDDKKKISTKVPTQHASNRTLARDNVKDVKSLTSTSPKREVQQKELKRSKLKELHGHKSDSIPKKSVVVPRSNIEKPIPSYDDSSAPLSVKKRSVKPVKSKLKKAPAKIFNHKISNKSKKKTSNKSTPFKVTQELNKPVAGPLRKQKGKPITSKIPSADSVIISNDKKPRDKIPKDKRPGKFSIRSKKPK